MDSSVTTQYNDEQQQEAEPLMRWYPYGHDFGNTEVSDTTVVKGEQHKRSVPTAFLRVDPNTMKNLGVDVNKLDAFVIQMQDEPFAFAFGDLALAQNVPTWNGRGDDLRYASRYSLWSMLSISSIFISDKEYGLYVVCGLPADTYMKNLTLRNEIKRELDGVYSFTMDGGKTWRIVHIEIATVVMEGAGALLAYTGRNGAASTSANAEAAVIDIGGGTTDLYAQKGQIPQTEFCKNSRTAVETATQMLMDAFEKKYRALSQFEAREIMHAYASRQQPGGKGKAKGKPYPPLSNNGDDITPEQQEAIVKPIVGLVGEDIASFVVSTWRQGGGAARFKPVLMVGGGFYYFYNVVKKRIQHLDYPEDPVHANSIGYATLAARLLQRRNQSQQKAQAQDEPAATIETAS